MTEIWVGKIMVHVTIKGNGPFIQTADKDVQVIASPNLQIT